MQQYKFLVKGLGGKKTLNGTIAVNGAKNSILKAMAASVLFEDRVVLKNVPQNEDVKKMTKLLEKLGLSVVAGKGGELKIEGTRCTTTDLDYELAKSFRGSVVLTGPLLARCGKVSFPMPGGCVIGNRPVDLFLEAYKKMGARVEEKNDRYVVTLPKGKLHGAEIFFNIQTVGGTETLMMAAVLAKGKTVLKNCAMEPEIVNLAEFLISCGAKIKGAGTPTMEIVGGRPLQAAGRAFKTIPDRIEAGSLLVLGALCADNLEITNCNPQHLEAPINMLRDSGVNIETTKTSIKIKNNSAIPNNSFKPFNIRTHEYPGFATDLQAPFVTFLTQTSGGSTVLETIFDGRFKYVEDLIKMGAKITSMDTRQIQITGPVNLEGQPDLQAHDIRAGFAVLTAALLAKGDSVINNIYYIDRGYEKIEERLRKIGAQIERVEVKI